MGDESDRMEERDRAARQLEAIHAFMERAGRFSNLSGWSCILAGLLAIAGAATSSALELRFHDAGVDRRSLALIWGSVVLLAAAQNAILTIVQARRRGEPAWTDLTRTVVIAVTPGFFMGAVMAVLCSREDVLHLLPGLWMLAYGASLVGLGLFAGTHIHVFGAAFLALGAVSALYLQEHGLLMMGVSFGGLHLLAGGWIVARYRM